MYTACGTAIFLYPTTYPTQPESTTNREVSSSDTSTATGGGAGHLGFTRQLTRHVTRGVARGVTSKLDSGFTRADHKVVANEDGERTAAQSRPLGSQPGTGQPLLNPPLPAADFSRLSYLLSHGVPNKWSSADIAAFLRRYEPSMASIAPRILGQHVRSFEFDPSRYGKGEPSPSWPADFDFARPWMPPYEAKQCNTLIDVMDAEPELTAEEFLARAQAAAPTEPAEELLRWYFAAPRPGQQTLRNEPGTSNDQAAVLSNAPALASAGSPNADALGKARADSDSDEDLMDYSPSADTAFAGAQRVAVWRNHSGFASDVEEQPEGSSPSRGGSDSTVGTASKSASGSSFQLAVTRSPSPIGPNAVTPPLRNSPTASERTPSPVRLETVGPAPFTIADIAVPDARVSTTQPELLPPRTYRSPRQLPRANMTGDDFPELSHLLSQTIPLEWRCTDVAHFLRETGHPLGALSNTTLRTHSRRCKVNPSFYANGKPAAGWPETFRRPGTSCAYLPLTEATRLGTLLRQQPRLGVAEFLEKAAALTPETSAATLKRWYFSEPRLGQVSTQLKLAEARIRSQEFDELVRAAQGTTYRHHVPSSTSSAPAQVAEIEIATRSLKRPAEELVTALPRMPVKDPSAGHATPLDALVAAADNARDQLLAEAPIKKAPARIWQPQAHLIEPAVDHQFI